MDAGGPRVIAVRHGAIEPTGSWLYVWLDIVQQAVAYVGATGYDPELRAYLHVTSDDPREGTIRATIPDHTERNFDVLAFALPRSVLRPAAKAALIRELASRGYVASSDDAEPMPDVTTPIVDAVEQHLVALRRAGP